MDKIAVTPEQIDEFIFLARHLAVLYRDVDHVQTRLAELLQVLGIETPEKTMLCGAMYGGYAETLDGLADELERNSGDREN